MTPEDRLAGEATHLREIVNVASAMLRSAGFEGESLAEQVVKAIDAGAEVEYLRRELALLREGGT